MDKLRYPVDWNIGYRTGSAASEAAETTEIVETASIDIGVPSASPAAPAASSAGICICSQKSIGRCRTDGGYKPYKAVVYGEDNTGDALSR